MEDLTEDFAMKGWVSGKVVTDPSSPIFIGAPHMDCASSEASALFWAVMQSITQANDYDIVIFHFDALNVRLSMDGSYHFAEKYAIVGYLRMLMQVAEAIYKEQLHQRTLWPSYE